MEIKLNSQCKQAFAEWLRVHPPARYSRLLRQVLLEYIEDAVRAGIFPLWLPEFISASQQLLALLDMTMQQKVNTMLPNNEKMLCFLFLCVYFYVPMFLLWFKKPAAIGLNPYLSRH